MIDRLLAFLEFDTETDALAKALFDLITPQIDGVIERFYQRLIQYDVSPALTADVIPALKKRQKQHWLTLFKSGFGPDYCARARRIAIRHRDIDLNPLWYVAAYVRLKLEYIDAIMDSEYGPITKRKLLNTLEKYIAVDMALALSTYDAIVLS